MTVTITGNPFYDGIIEGTLFIPAWFAERLNQFGVYNIGFWIGLVIFFGVIIRLFFWGGGNS